MSDYSLALIRPLVNTDKISSKNSQGSIGSAAKEGRKKERVRKRQGGNSRPELDMEEAQWRFRGFISAISFIKLIILINSLIHDFHSSMPAGMLVI